MYLNMIKVIHDKPVSNIVLTGEILKIFSKVRNETRLSSFSTLI
jgi:hypothetical protein